MTSDQTHIIVGASLAGAKAAETLREEGFDGRVVLVGAEDERPYERPPLSKDYLRGEVGREKVYVHDESFYAEHDIELRLGTTAVDLNTSSQRADARRRRPAALRPAAARHGLRAAPAGHSRRRARRRPVPAQRPRLRRSCTNGWTAVARSSSSGPAGSAPRSLPQPASAASRSPSSSPASVPLERVLGAEVGAIYRDIHTDHGVEMLMGTGVEAFEGDKAVERVRTSDGRVIECDFVVVGVGVEPRIQLAARAGLDVDNGILVDEHLETSVPGVFAAGDVANARHPFYGERIRVEHWANALHQGPAAARNMLGHADAFDRLPYFFSDQYDVGMEYSGFARDWDRVVFRGDPASREFIAFWISDERVVAGMNVNVWDVNDPIRRLISERVTVDDRRLADPDVPIDELVAAAARRCRMNRLQALHDAGVSIWLDNLSRDLLDSGAFAALISRVRGHRGDLEPDHLRQGDHRLGPLRRPAARPGRLRDR